ncbi:hypothetical protein A8L34_28225 [Bacillus sp. FJAT-27264]|uniref:TraG/VirB4 family ATPase n=1 Tax=Paenibacillus sp. (strain DSM 101736 / FJAT-27264) TaxID=1850362 RepID=UPI000807CC67|nr:TraC family protein [Bacillus sp. FJAT-27264]OBZ15936.1 hypothetical protein A8L34_28225 [Bacillus sp. FJAT-27264]
MSTLLKSKRIRDYIPFLSKKEPEDIRQVLPFSGYTDYLHMKDGTFRAVLKVTPVNSELLTEDENEYIIEALQEVVNTIPGMQQITISSERLNVDEYLEYLQRKYDESRDVFFLERLNHTINHAKRYAQNQRNTKSFYLTFCSTNKEIHRAQEDFEEVIKRIEESLQSAEIYIKVLSEDDGKQMLYEKMNPVTSLLQPYTPGMPFRALSPAPITNNNNHMIVDGMYYRFYTIIDYPLKVKPAWFSRIFNLRGSTDTNIFLNATDKGKVIKSVSTSVGELNFRMTQNLPADEKIRTKRDRDASENLLEEISSENENVFNVTVVISVKERNLKDLNLSCDRLQTAISSAKMRSRQLVNMGNDPFWMTLPIAYSSPYLKHKNMIWPMQSSIIGSILPFSSSDLMMKSGVVKGKNPSTESLIITDRRDRHAADNPNEVVIAPSGRGKSWYGKADMLRELQQGTKIVVIDPDREYMFNYGERVIFSIGSKYTTNPFHIRSAIVDSDDDNEEMYKENVGQFLMRKIADIIPFFRWIYPDMTSTEAAQLSEAIRLMYEKISGLTFESKSMPEKFPTLSDLQDIMQEKFAESLKNVLINLQPYVDGIYSSMFNGQTNWTMDKMLTILDINTLSEEVQKPMMHLLLMDIWEYCKLDRKEKKGLYVDEAWKLASPDNPQTLKFLFEIAKRIRKYGGFLTTITQNVNDFFNTGESKHGQAIFDNAFSKMFLGLSDKDYITLVEGGFSFSEKEKRILTRRVSKGRGIYIFGSTRVQIQTSPTLDELQFIDVDEYNKLNGAEVLDQQDEESVWDDREDEAS